MSLLSQSGSWVAMRLRYCVTGGPTCEQDAPAIKAIPKCGLCPCPNKWQYSALLHSNQATNTSPSLLLQGAVTGDLSPAPAAAAAAVLAATAATTYIPAYLSSGGSTDAAGIAAGFGDALKVTFKAGRGWTGVFYSLSFWESFILGVALVGGPILPTVVSYPENPVAVNLWSAFEAVVFWAVAAAGQQDGGLFQKLDRRLHSAFRSLHTSRVVVLWQLWQQ